MNTSTLKQTNTLEHFYTKILLLEKQYPQRLSFQTIGTSHLHHPIFLLQLGHGPEHILLTGGIHGRESINPWVLLDMLKHYMDHWSHYSAYFEAHTLFVIPMLNPDGILMASKHFTWKENGRGIDLNRNFPCQSWRPKFPHDMPESEPETRALIDVFEQLEPSVYLDFHSRGEGIYYYRNSMDAAYNARQKKWAQRMSQITGYTLYEPEEEVPAKDSGGNTVQYFAEIYKKPAFTIETVPEDASFPLSMSYVPRVFQEIYELPMLF